MRVDADSAHVVAAIVMLNADVEAETGGFGSVAGADTLDCNEVREAASEIRLQEFLAPSFGFLRCDKKAIVREVDVVGRSSNSRSTRAVGDDRRINAQRSQAVCEKQTAGRPVGFGARRLCVRNEEAGDDCDLLRVLREVDCSGRKLAGSESRGNLRRLPGRIQFAADEPAPSGIAVSESLELIK